MTRAIIRVSGADRDAFLKGLLTRDVPTDGGLGYAALLSPQGKYLADFLCFRDEGAVWLDTHADLAPALVQRLSMYRLRADVGIDGVDRGVACGTGDAPAGAMADPRPGMGWRHYDGAASDGTDWDAVRVAHMVPAYETELVPNDSYILEWGFDRLGGVDFRKGCYVGQEVTARMKHKTELRKGMARVRLDGPAAPGDPITADGRPAGHLCTVAGDRALAYLRFDRAGGGMTAGASTLHRDA
ncbi:folate-binding protein [Jannaschia sp. LMIT008]|uniref:CAF17-like 4Fe-4S cluster assembly/insertion protein YgfZ n=1 Tax=Jannaschia maritima TaxID=3032585 RepID=UPI002810BD64|nr:folate-binding protein [Jannaschia sp. LMIT008]